MSYLCRCGAVYLAGPRESGQWTRCRNCGGALHLVEPIPRSIAGSAFLRSHARWLWVVAVTLAALGIQAWRNIF